MSYYQETRMPPACWVNVCQQVINPCIRARNTIANFLFHPPFAFASLQLRLSRTGATPITEIRFPSLCLSLALVGGCSPLIASYNLDAYKNATTLKAQTGALIEKSNEPYAQHQKDVDTLTTNINAAYEFAAGLPDNQIAAQQWQILRDPRGNLYGGFVRRWKQSGTLGATYRVDKETQINRAFNYIICLEANKNAPTVCPTAASAQVQTQAN
jgi:hypothetical protein